MLKYCKEKLDYKDALQEAKLFSTLAANVYQSGKFVYYVESLIFNMSWCTSEINLQSILHGSNIAVFSNYLK